MTAEQKERLRQINEGITKIATGEWIPRTELIRKDGMVTVRSYIEVNKWLRK